MGRAILDFVHPSSLEDTLERISALHEPGMVSEPTEAVLVRQDGSPTVVESISVRIDWEGEPAYQVILRDATERRRAEAATRYQASLVSHVSDAIIATDPSGRILSWNPAAEALYGVRTTDAIGRPAAELLGPQAVEADGIPRAGEVDHDRADGQTLRVLVSVGPVRDEIGDVTGAVAVCTDLTERLERQAAEERYSAAVAALEEGVLVVDRDGTVVSVNSSAEAMLGEGLRRDGGATIAFDRRPMISEDGRPLAPEDHPLAVGLRTGWPQSRVVIGVDRGARHDPLVRGQRPASAARARRPGRGAGLLLLGHHRPQDRGGAAQLPSDPRPADPAPQPRPGAARHRRRAGRRGRSPDAASR